MRMTFGFIGTVVLTGMVAMAHADIFANYENLDEGFLGSSFTDQGVTYRDVNNVSGVQPDGNPFGPGDMGDQVIVENATFLYNDFPGYGSPIKGLTFGSAYIPGDNLSIGALASVYMDINQASTAASLFIAFYENGPWGGIEYHLDALHNNAVVASDSFLIADGGGRDNPTFTTMSVGGPAFETLHLYATLNGNYVAPRGIIDNLSITTAPVPEPATMLTVGLGALALLRKRRR